MRKETNLDPYYKRMKLEEINRLSTMMGDMQYEAQRWQSLMKYDEFRLERPDDWEWTKSLRRMDISRAAQSIDRYMISIGQESLFGMEEKARKDFTDDDIRRIAIRARVLEQVQKATIKAGTVTAAE